MSEAITHPYLTAGLTSVLAHRGASAAHPPGNTWRAFEAAVAFGVDHLETDVRATADDQLVLFHDDRLDELTTATGAVRDHEWRDLESVRYLVNGEPSEHGLVRFDDFLRRFGDVFLNIDAKTDEVVAPLVSLLRAEADPERVCIAAFGLRRIRELRAQLGRQWCSALSRPEIAALFIAGRIPLPFPIGGDVAQIPVEFRGVRVADARTLSAAHVRGIAVHVWTVNDDDRMEELLRAGFDGVITDRPDLAIDVVRGLGR